MVSALAQSRRSSSAGCRRREAGDELARGRRRWRSAAAKTSKPPLPVDRPPIRCSIPSCSACHQVPRTWVMPVPGGAVPAPAGEAGAGDGALTIAGEALEVGAVEGIGAGGWHAVGVGAELGATGRVRPVWRRRRRTSRTGRRRTCRPAPRRRSAAAAATASAIPIATIRANPPRVPDIRPPFARLRMEAPRAGPADSLPLWTDRGCRTLAFARMIAMALPTKDQITEQLRAVIDPELRKNIVELGMVRSIDVQESGRVEVIVSLTTAGCPIRSHFEQAVDQAGLRAGGRDRRSGSASTSSPTRRKATCRKRSAAASCRRARWPRSRT